MSLNGAGTGTETGPVTVAEATLEAVCQVVKELAGTGAARPRRIVVRHCGTELDIEWADPSHPPAPQPTAPQPTAPQPAMLAAGAVLEPAAAADAAAAGLVSIRAAVVGTFYRAAEPGARPFVEVGHLIDAGHQVGIIEVMKLMTSVDADVAGRIAEILVADGAPVEYGQPLFSIEVADQ